MIYIDPPYNTGNDFVYEDDFAESAAEYLANSGQFDEQGNRLVTNTESNGRFHTDWLNMIYPRLKVARDFLTEDGVIFISIDDNEVANLRKVCDEVFGEENFVGKISWLKKRKGSFLSKKMISITEYVLLYGKKQDITLFGGEPDQSESQPLIKRTNSRKRLTFPANAISTKLDDGLYQAGIYGEGSSSVNIINDVFAKNGIIETPLIVDGPFIWSQENLDHQIALGAKFTINTLNFQIRTFKVYEDIAFKGLSSFIDGVSINGTNEDGYEELKKILEAEKILDYPKPINLMKLLIDSSTHFASKDSIILDFFSGSATTAHAVMQLNAEDGGNRKFICVQLPEQTPEDSEARKAGYTTIPEIAKERIRRAGKKILEEQKAKAEKEGMFTEETKKLDIGFKVFKLDSSNIYAWDDNPENLEGALFNSVRNIKTDRKDDDLLYEILIKYGIELSEKINRHTIAGKTVYEMGAGSLIVCLADTLTLDVAEGIGKLYKDVSPEGIEGDCRVIFKDAGFNGSDEVKTNTMLILKQHGIINVASV